MASQPTDLGRPVQEGDVFGPYADLYPGQVITTPCGRVFTVEPDGKHIRCTHVPPSTLYDRGARTESEPIGAKAVANTTLSTMPISIGSPETLVLAVITKSTGLIRE